MSRELQKLRRKAVVQEEAQQAAANATCIPSSHAACSTDKHTSSHADSTPSPSDLSSPSTPNDALSQASRTSSSTSLNNNNSNSGSEPAVPPITVLNTDGVSSASILIIPAMFIFIFIRCPLTWDR